MNVTHWHVNVSHQDDWAAPMRTTAQGTYTDRAAALDKGDRICNTIREAGGELAWSATSFPVSHRRYANGERESTVRVWICTSRECLKELAAVR